MVHAKRVRRFTATGPPYLGHQEYEALLMSAGPRVLLPNLKELRWCQSDDTIFPFIQLFLSPNISNVELDLNGSPLIRLSLLESLNVLYPSLTHLELDHSLTSFGGDAERYKEAISAAICGWRELKSLSTCALSSKGLRHAAMLPNLEKLHLFGVRDAHPPGLPLPKNSSAFQALSYLEVYCDKLTFCTGIVQAMSNGILKKVTLAYEVAATSLELMKFLAALDEHCGHTSLLEIDASISDSDSPSIEAYQAPEFIIRATHLKPILSFQRLTDVCLHPCGFFDLDDADVESLAMALPDIQILYLDGESKGPVRHRATLSGLTAFAEHCKRLCSLAIAFDATVIPILKPGPKVSSESLTGLRVLHSPIAQPKQVAAFLSDLFPNLSFISNKEREYRADRGVEEAEEDQDKKWVEVEGLIAVLASVRAQEMARWTLERKSCTMEVDGRDVVEGTTSLLS
jgi:hypothetical protein